MLQEEREWLLVIHCTNHRLELAMKSAFLSDSAFKDVDKILLEMYLLTRDSGKVKRLLKAIALRLNVMFVTFVKSDGTRFQNHKYRAIKALIINYIPMSMLMENYVEAGSQVGRKSYHFLFLCFFIHYFFISNLM